MTPRRKDEVKQLDPAHIRVLDLLLKPEAFRRPGHVNIAFMAIRTHWEDRVIWSLLYEARKFLGVNTTQQLAILWREKRRK